MQMYLSKRRGVWYSNVAVILLFCSCGGSVLLPKFNNCITKMEVGCLKHPGASTVGSQLLDEDCSHGWQILATQP